MLVPLRGLWHSVRYCAPFLIPSAPSRSGCAKHKRLAFCGFGRFAPVRLSSRLLCLALVPRASTRRAAPPYSVARTTQNAPFVYSATPSFVARSLCPWCRARWRGICSRHKSRTAPRGLCPLWRQPPRPALLGVSSVTRTPPGVKGQDERASAPLTLGGNLVSRNRARGRAERKD